MTQPSPDEQSLSPNDQPTILQSPDDRPAQTARPVPFDLASGVQAEMAAAAAAPTEGSGAPLPLSRIGDYEILSTVGRGGMGVVFKARHVRLGRIVALKMLSAGLLARPEDVQRFETEAAAAAQLQHPNIVALYEAGSSEGQPYFSMEFVHGSSLANRVALGPLPSRLAASYLERLARAVHYAHTRGIIHRDLKPANVLLDDADEPKISDFGLAKLMQGESGQTRTGTVMGTPSYMAPEQANARKDVGPSCDIYSLGAILYELLTAIPPFRGKTALDTLVQVASTEPTAPHLLNSAIDRDLETICLKCLEKEPARRYATAAALADDLRRFLGGEPITARRLGPVRRTAKWVQRKPATAALLFVIAAALLGFAGFEWHAAEQQRQLREDAEEQRQIAERQAELAREQTKLVEKAHDEVAFREKYLRHLLYVAESWQTQQAWEDSDLRRARFLLQSWQPRPGERDLRQWEWYYLQGLCGGDRALNAHPGRAGAVAYRPQGKRLATAGGQVGKPGEVKIWDAATGKLLLVFPRKHTNAIAALAYSPNGQVLATAGNDRTVRLWDPDAGKELAVLKGHANRVTSVAFSHDGRLLASGDGDGVILIHDLGKPGKYVRLHTLKGHTSEVTGLAFQPGCTTLASSGYDETVRLWDAAGGKLVKTLWGHEGEVLCLAFNAKGNVLVSGGGPGKLGGQLKRWDMATGKELQTHDGLGQRVLTVAVGKGDHVAAGCNDGFIYLWNERKSTEPIHIRADTRPIYDVAFRPDGKRLATAGGSGTVRVWNSSGGTESLLLAAPQRAECLAYSPTSQVLAVAGRSPDRDGEVYLFDTATGKRKDVLRGHAGTVHAVAFGPTDTLVATGGEDQTVRVYDLTRGGPPVTLRGHRGRVMAVAFDRTGGLLASAAAEDEDVILWDVASGTEKARLPGHRIGVLALAFSPNGDYLAAAGYDKAVHLWNVDRLTGKVLEGHTATVQALAFSPDSKQLASGGIDQDIIVWDVEPAAEFLRLEGSPGPITSLAWQPRGQRIASVGPDRSVRLWDPVTKREVLQLQGPTGSPRGVAFSPDGWQLATAGDYPFVHVWDARPR